MRAATDKHMQARANSTRHVMQAGKSPQSLPAGFSVSFGAALAVTPFLVLSAAGLDEATVALPEGAEATGASCRAKQEV